MKERFKEIFSETRWDEIVSEVKRLGMNIDYTMFTPDEVEFILGETRMTDSERKGGILLFCKGLSRKQICDSLVISRSTLWRHEKKVRPEIKRTCCRIFK